MSKYLKAGILTLVLVMPALVVLFLHGFAENHFKLPYLVPTIDSTGQVKMSGKDTLFYQVPGASDIAISVIGFFGENANNQLKEGFGRVEKLASKSVIVEIIKEKNVEQIATQKFKVSPIKKAKSIETIGYDKQFLLIDRQGFIRGIYDGTNHLDVDRLVVETKILLDIYKKEEK